MNTIRTYSVAQLILCALALTACGGGGSEEPPDDSGDPGPGPGPGSGSGDDPALTYSIGGSVTGMTGSGLLISNNTTDELTLDASGNFVFAGELEDAEDYDVQIVAQPANPDNVCTLANGSGTVNAADVADVQIECTGPLALIDTAPADDDQNVSRAIEPILTFSEDIDSATVLPANITLVSDAGDVALSFDVSGSEITLSPENILLPLTEYTLTVTTDVQGSDGGRLLDPVTRTFKTRDASWKTDNPIDDAAGTANDAQITFDNDGNALAVWYQASATGTDLWSNYYTAGVGWGTAGLVEHNDVDLYAGSPRVGFDADGNALAVWTQTNGATGGSIWSSRFVPGSGWDTPVLVETEPGDVAGFVELAMHESGDAVAVWRQFDGTGTSADIWANRHTAGSGWGSAEIIDDADETVNRPQVVINPDGAGLAVWEQRPATTGAVWGRHYTTADGWDDMPVPISVGNLPLNPRPAIDADGNALVVYDQENGFDRSIYASHYTVAGGWETQRRVEPGQGGHEPQVAFDAHGNALAIWKQPENAGGTVVIDAYVSRYTPGGGWETPRSISSGEVFHPKIAFDASGHALAVWYELDLSLPSATGYSVRGNRYTAGSGWTSSEQIGSNGSLIGTFMPNLAIDASGDAFAIWTRSAEVRVNRFE
jgi:hypothetical protein